MWLLSSKIQGLPSGSLCHWSASRYDCIPSSVDQQRLAYLCKNLLWDLTSSRCCWKRTRSKVIGVLKTKARQRCCPSLSVTQYLLTFPKTSGSQSQSHCLLKGLGAISDKSRHAYKRRLEENQAGSLRNCTWDNNMSMLGPDHSYCINLLHSTPWSWTYFTVNMVFLFFDLHLWLGPMINMWNILEETKQPKLDMDWSPAVNCSTKELTPRDLD